MARIAPWRHWLPPSLTHGGIVESSRHANASHAKLNLAFTTDTVTLTVEDNGQGFVVPESPAMMAAIGHFGLLGIQERVELIGAHVTIQSETGVGTHLIIIFQHRGKSDRAWGK